MSLPTTHVPDGLFEPPRLASVLIRTVCALVTLLLIGPMFLQLCLIAGVLLVFVALFAAALLVALPLRTLVVCVPSVAALIALAAQMPVQAGMVLLFVPTLTVFTPLLSPVVLVAMVMYETLQHEAAASSGRRRWMVATARLDG